MSQNNIVTKSDLGDFYSKILPYLGSGLKLAGPVGMIISYMGTTAPSGYLACDGSWYDIGDYPKLANWMMDEFNSYSYFALSGETVQSGKFKVPDLRGEFLRGTGTNSHANQGSGESVGVHQDGTKNPVVTFRDTNFGVNPESNTQYLNPEYMDFFTQNSGLARNYSATVNHLSTSEQRAVHYTSRPTNTSVLYCIKYEEYEGDGAGEIYSTDERVIGKWIDGSTLYQKTISTTSASAINTWTDRNHSIANIDLVVNFFGCMVLQNGNALPLNFSLYKDSGNYYTSVTKTVVTMYTDRVDYINLPTYVTVQYTKTTDTSNSGAGGSGAGGAQL